MESTDLTSIFPIDHRHYRVERDAVALVADATHTHQRSSDRGNLEDGVDLTSYLAIAQIELALAKVGDRASISHQELLSSAAPWGLTNSVAWDIVYRTNVDN